MAQRRWLYGAAIGGVAMAALLIIGAGVLGQNSDLGGPPITTATSSTTQPELPSPGDLNGEPVRLAVAGDVGTGGVEAYMTAEVIDERDEVAAFDALLLLGDNVYENGDPSQVGEKVFEPFGPVLDEPTKIVAVLGNHDVRNNNGPAQAEALGMPGRWHSQTIGDVLIIGLDSNLARNEDQLEWLAETLEGPRPKFTIVMMHHPAFSAGKHGGSLKVQETFVPLFDAHGVDLVLSGHDHDYQRSHDINGVTYVISGAAAKLRPTGTSDFTAVSHSTYHFVELEIFADRITGKAIDHSGTIIDWFEIR